MSTEALTAATISIGDVGTEYLTALSKRKSQQLAITIDGQTAWHAFDNGMTVETRLELPDRPIDDVRDVVTTPMNHEIARIDPEHLHGVGDKPLEPIQFFVDDDEQLAIARVRHARQQITRGRLHRCKGRLEFVRQRVKNGRAELAALPGRFSAGRRLVSARSLQPDGREVRD
jgi:hypothetical protein